MEGQGRFLRPGAFPPKAPAVAGATIGFGIAPRKSRSSRSSQPFPPIGAGSAFPFFSNPGRSNLARGPTVDRDRKRTRAEGAVGGKGEPETGGPGQVASRALAVRLSGD
jgi:hypothetical protein